MRVAVVVHATADVYVLEVRPHRTRDSCRRSLHRLLSKCYSDNTQRWSRVLSFGSAATHNR